MIKGQENLIPGQGRKPGSKNKKTLERQAAFQKYLLEKNALFRLLDELFNRLENDPKSVRTADIIKALSWLAPYEIRTIAEQEAAERVDQILGSAQEPSQMKAEIIEFFSLKAV
ncbi:hypothetical protein L4K91_004483 [Salmonella enterica]|nr:hypothetical protein [Salmonella enterica]EDR5805972.1 hypothetical protein [Salmonella enterica subsp. enterica serovar Saintpaul]EDX5289420.1 hypothetical protein [Salmonella enterica subsp. enterica serovar Javiana]EBJ3044339.1 hypothetical protein [Salmonella enterica]EBL1889421.1 hypothetical protein [Salmonella enterica]